MGSFNPKRTTRSTSSAGLSPRARRYVRPDPRDVLRRAPVGRERRILGVTSATTQRSPGWVAQPGSYLRSGAQVLEQFGQRAGQSSMKRRAGHRQTGGLLKTPAKRGQRSLCPGRKAQNQRPDQQNRVDLAVTLDDTERSGVLLDEEIGQEGCQGLQRQRTLGARRLAPLFVLRSEVAFRLWMTW